MLQLWPYEKRLTVLSWPNRKNVYSWEQTVWLHCEMTPRHLFVLMETTLQCHWQVLFCLGVSLVLCSLCLLKKAGSVCLFSENLQMLHEKDHLKTNVDGSSAKFSTIFNYVILHWLKLEDWVFQLVKYVNTLFQPVTRYLIMWTLFVNSSMICMLVYDVIQNWQPLFFYKSSNAIRGCCTPINMIFDALDPL